MSRGQRFNGIAFRALKGFGFYNFCTRSNVHSNFGRDGADVITIERSGIRESVYRITHGGKHSKKIRLFARRNKRVL